MHVDEVELFNLRELEERGSSWISLTWSSRWRDMSLDMNCAPSKVSGNVHCQAFDRASESA